MIRSILLILEFAAYLILTWPVIRILDHRKDTDRKARFTVMKMAAWQCRTMLAIAGARIHAEGLENIPDADGVPVQYVSNHRSDFDPMLLYIFLKQPTGFIGKQEWKRIPLLKGLMHAMGTIFIDRSNVREGLKSINEGIEMAKDGWSLAIYPEGTRLRKKKGIMPDLTEPAEFKDGSLKMAQRSGLKVVTVTVIGTEKLFENHIPFLRPADVTIIFGTPIGFDEIPEEYKKHRGSYFRSLIVQNLKARELEHEDKEPEEIESEAIDPENTELELNEPEKEN